MRQQGVQRALGSVALTAALISLLATPANTRSVFAQVQSAGHIFTETGHTLSGEFLDYWTGHGGVDLQGYPISEQMQEASLTDGKTYTVQYFQRSELQAHPENQPPQNVQLTLLSTYYWNQKYAAKPPIQVPNQGAGSQLFPQTGKRLGGLFLQYWQQHGGLDRFGYPLSDEFNEVSTLNGHPYVVQYFERAVMESHPENQAPYNVLLSQLGTFAYDARYGSGAPTATPVAPPPPPPPPPTATPTTAPPATATAVPKYRVEAWVSDRTPVQGEVVTVYGQVVRDGKGQQGVLMDAYWKIKTGPQECKATTGKEGIALCSRNIGAAPAGKQVSITVNFIIAPGVIQSTSTSFTPR